jgi:hypothetical protein
VGHDSPPSQKIADCDNNLVSASRLVAGVEKALIGDWNVIPPASHFDSTSASRFHGALCAVTAAIASRMTSSAYEGAVTDGV